MMTRADEPGSIPHLVRLGAAMLVAGLLLATPATAARKSAIAAAELAANPFVHIDRAIAEGRLPAAQMLILHSPLAADDPRLLLRSAEVALADGRLPEAAARFFELTGQAEIAAKAQQGLGLAKLRLGDLPAAVAALDAAVAADATLIRAHVARGVVADKQRDWPVSEAAYARALAIDPVSVPALGNRGYSRLLRGDYSAAESDLQQAMLQDPEHKLILNNLRLARAMQGRYSEAFVGATKKELPAVMNTVGFAAMVRGDDAVAESYFRRAMALNPTFDKTAAANLALIAERRQAGKSAGAPAAGLPAPIPSE